MGLLDFMRGKIQCPSCGTWTTKRNDRIRCPNPSCPYFDADVRPVTRRYRNPATGEPGTYSIARRGDFSPARPLTIHYRNFQGQEKTFAAEAGSAVRKRNHIVVRVAPTGQRITLSRDRIQNLREVEGALAAWPTPRERQVLAYHKKRKSTSPLYEKIRARYPDW